MRVHVCSVCIDTLQACSWCRLCLLGEGNLLHQAHNTLVIVTLPGQAALSLSAACLLAAWPSVFPHRHTFLSQRGGPSSADICTHTRKHTHAFCVNKQGNEVNAVAHHSLQSMFTCDRVTACVCV